MEVEGGDLEDSERGAMVRLDLDGVGSGGLMINR